jgi:hypothetical protein
MKPQRYLMTYCIWDQPDYDRIEPETMCHLPGDWQRGERMTKQDVEQLVLHAARNAERWDVYDYGNVPGIELIQRPITPENTVRVQRILGVTIDTLNIDLFSGGS